MEFYFALGLVTAAIAALAGLLFLKTRHLGFPVGIALLYYWSLYGAWSIVTDRIGGDSEKKYDYLTERMFPVDLDEHYMSALVLYAGFILLIEMTLLWSVTTGANVGPRRRGRPIWISHTAIFIMAAVSLLGSLGIMAEQLTSATEMNISAYVATRGGLGAYHPLFTIHQLLNRTAIFGLAIGLAVYLAGEKGVFLRGSSSVAAGFAYAGLLLLTFGFLAMLGNKNELFSALILGGVFYTTNTRHINWKSAMPIGIVAFLAIGAINFLRSLPVLALLDSETWWEAIAQAPEIRSSGEAFAAHFSLYGVLYFHAPLTYGASFVMLATSLVPRFYWGERSLGTYVDYAEALSIYEGPTGEAYTVHHATGWYLNFGLWGLIAGALLLGAIWAICYNAHCRAKIGDRGWRSMLAVIAPAGFVSFIPPLVRAGPETYKGMIIEAFIIPTVIILFTSISWGRIFGARAIHPPSLPDEPDPLYPGRI
jgi:hypothetical protein